MQSSKAIQLQDLSKQEQSDQDYTEVYVWGSNHQGQLGIGHKYAGKTYIGPKAWSFNQIILQMSCGEEHSAFLTLRGQVYTMGSNSEGRLGIGDPSVKYSATPCPVELPARLKASQVSCGASHTVVVTDSGEVFSWGHGAHGALGTGSIADAWEPVQVCLEEKSFIGVKKVSAGSKHTAFVTNLGTLYVCGTGETGQLGTGRREKELLPVHVNLISEKVRDVVCGAFHTLILVERGRVYATGGNTLGQLGLGNKKNTNIPIRIKEFDHDKVVQIGAGHHSAALTERGDLFIWGTGVFGEYLNPVKFSYPGVKFKDISLGAFFGVAIDEESNVWTWGSNANGELGTDSTDLKGKVAHNPFFDGKKIETVSCGGSFAIGLGQTIRNRRRSPSRLSESPLKSRIHGASVDISESPQRKFHGQRKLNDSVAISYEIEEGKSLQQIAEKEKTENKEASVKKAGHFRGNSIDRTRIRTNETGKSQARTRKEDKRDVSEGNPKGEDPLVTLLMKQKAVLEKCLRDEKQEKLTLEQSLLELKKRMIDLQEGPGGFSDLGQMMSRQAKKFDDLKTMYDEESNKRERMTREYQTEKQKNRELTETLIEKEEKIITLQKMVDTLELRAREKQRETEEFAQNLLHHNGKLKQELEHKIEDVLRLQNTVEDFKAEVKEKKDLINKLEESLNKELSEKRELEFEIRNLSLTLEAANNSIQHTNSLLQQETALRGTADKDLEASLQREEALKARLQQMEKEFEQVQSLLEQNLAAEQETNAQIAQELEDATNAGTEKDGENEELKRRVEALEQDLQEHQEKNKKLINLLSNEIEKQAEQFKKKTYDALVGPASKLAQNIIKASKEHGDDEYISVQNLKASNPRESIIASTVGSRQANGNSGITWPAGKESMFSHVMTSWPVHGNQGNAHINIIGVDSPSNGETNSFNGTGSEPLDLEKLRKELYEDKSTVESRMDRLEHSPRAEKYDQLGKRQQIYLEKFNGEGTGTMTLSSECLRQDDLEGTFGAEKEEIPIKPLKFTGAFMGRGNQAVEDARARLCRSANKLRDILDIPEHENRVEKIGKSTNTTPVKENKKDNTPTRGQKGENTPVKEDKKGQSEKKGSAQKKSPSPYKVPTFRSSIDYESSQGDIQEMAHLQNLKEVKERLELLQRNKQVLENKMQTYETKLKTVNN